MSDDVFDSWAELGGYLKDNYIVEADDSESSDVGSSKNSGIKKGSISKGGKKNKATLRVTSREKTADLLKEIRHICAEAPWNLRGIINNEDIQIRDDFKGNIVVTVPFRNKAYKQNVSKRHYSFIPVLMDRGWVTKYASIPGYTPGTRQGKKELKESGRPTFAYFAGTHELTAAIDKFNRENASLGMRAQLEFTEDMLGWVPNHYITSL